MTHSLDTLSFRNSVGATIPAGAVMEIVTGATDEEREIVLAIQKPTTAGIGKKLYAINSAWSVPSTGTGSIQSGPIFIVLSDGSSMTIGDEIGPINAQWYMNGTGSGFVYLGPDPTAAFTNSILVRALGGGSADLFYFTLTADLAKTLGATATATAFAANTLTGATDSITVKNPGLFRTFSGAKGLAMKVGEEYWILIVDQPALKILAQLDVHTTANRDGADAREAQAIIKTASPAPVALTGYPYSFVPTQDVSVPNPRDLWGEDGDYVELSWDTVADDYFVSKVFRQRQDFFWGTLASDHPGGLAATLSINPAQAASSGAYPSTPVSVTDTYNAAINAKSGDRVFLAWDGNSSGSYKPIISSHTTRKLRGTLFASFSTFQATFKLTPVANLDGLSPTVDVDGCITVHNLYNWTSGTVGNVCSVEWDTVLQRWHPTQMQWSCPP